MKNKLIYFPFVIAGSVTNFIFYLKFFNNTNYDPWIYIVISVIFTGITAILYYNGFKQHKKILVLCAVLISIFSVFCSTAGQFADSQTKINSQIGQHDIINQQQGNLDYAWSELERLNREWESLEAEKRATIKSAADRYEWKRTTANIDAQQIEIKKTKEKYENMIFDNPNKLQTVEKYAADIFDQISMDVKQKITIMLIFEILISIIIELVAPLALYLMTLNKPVIVDKVKKIEPVKKRTLPEWIRIYADARFIGNENTLKGRPAVISQTGMSIQVFNKITAMALKKKLITIEGKATKAGDFVNKEVFIKTMTENKGG